MAKYEDDELALLMAKVCDHAQMVVVKPNRKVLLHEKKVTPQLSGKQDTPDNGGQGDQNHHDTDIDDDDAETGEDLGKGAADEAVHGDHDHRETQSDDDHHDDGHGHGDYANGTDAYDPVPSMP